MGQPYSKRDRERTKSVVLVLRATENKTKNGKGREEMTLWVPGKSELIHCHVTGGRIFVTGDTFLYLENGFLTVF